MVIVIVVIGIIVVIVIVIIIAILLVLVIRFTVKSLGCRAEGSRAKRPSRRVVAGGF